MGIVGVGGVIGVGGETEGRGGGYGGLREGSRGGFWEVLSRMGVSWGSRLVRERVNEGVHGGDL